VDGEPPSNDETNFDVSTCGWRRGWWFFAICLEATLCSLRKNEFLIAFTLSNDRCGGGKFGCVHSVSNSDRWSLVDVCRLASCRTWSPHQHHHINVEALDQLWKMTMLLCVFIHSKHVLFIHSLLAT
jgi:hypothetical protein